MATSTVTVVVYDSVITAMSLPGGMVWRYGFQKARRTATLARAGAPKRTGQMAASIDAEYEGSERDSATMRVSADAPALWVHEGTQGSNPDEKNIKPRGKYLRLSPGGGYGVVYAKAVRGQKAQPFLTDALEAVIRTV